MRLINCSSNFILTWSDKCVLFNNTNEIIFAITDTKLYVPVVTLSTQDNAKLFEQVLNEQLIGTDMNQKY